VKDTFPYVEIIVMAEEEEEEEIVTLGLD